MNKAIFLDKDGTLVDNSGYPDIIPSDKIFFDKTVKGLKILQNAGFKLIIISSQPWIADGRLKTEQVDEFFNSVVTKYLKEGIKIDAYYYCPHNRSEGCKCKKPNTALLEMAVERFKIDPSESFFIGDMWEDILTGKNFGLKTILVKTGCGKDYNSTIEPDFIVEDVNEAAEEIWKKIKPVLDV